MKKEDLFEAFGDVDSNYIKEAHMKNSRKNSFSWAKWGTIAASLVLLVLCVPLAIRLLKVTDSEIPVLETLQIENVNEVESLQNSEESTSVKETSTADQNLEEEGIKELNETKGDDKKLSEVIQPESQESTVEDIPADKEGEYNAAIKSSALGKDISQFFGGSYTDSSGKFVIVLTEDTYVNRVVICEKLGRTENNTTFVTGKYTLAYLTELQAKITNAMVNKEIPFVVSSGVYEMSNNIIIGATTTDETELAKVYALDTIGGAIKVELVTEASTEDLAIAE